MLKRFCSKYNHRRRGQKGDILIPTLIFMMLGILVIVPLLGFMGTGLKAGTVISQKSAALYSADAGVEDAIWQIKYNQLKGKFSTYDPHDYYDNWTYSLPQVNGQNEINNDNVSVSINNDWVVKNITAPDVTTGNSIINNNKLIVTGGTYGASSYNIVITYYPGLNEVLKINTIGIWLPPGYTYQAHSSNLGSLCPDASTSAYQGGQAVIWTFSAINFTSLPGANPTNSPMTAKITFSYLPSTALTANAAAGSTSLSVTSTSGFPNSGAISLNGSRLTLIIAALRPLPLPEYRPAEIIR